jgi:hypothetical protein
MKNRTIGCCYRRTGIVIACISLLIGCSTTQLTYHSRGIEPPFCKNGLNGSSAAVYWDTAWRHDQKATELREKILAEGIGLFFNTNDCIRTVKISRTIGDKSIAMCTDSEIASNARSLGADKAIVMRFEKLGPNLIFYLTPILWQTKNEVLLRTKVLDSRKDTIETDTTTHCTGEVLSWPSARGVCPRISLELLKRCFLGQGNRASFSLSRLRVLWCLPFQWSGLLFWFDRFPLLWSGLSFWFDCLPLCSGFQTLNTPNLLLLPMFALFPVVIPPI